MQVRSGFKLNTVCGETFLVPMGETNIDFSKLIVLNESSQLLWKRMAEGEFTTEDLVQVLLDEYEVDEATARKDVEKLIEQFKKEGVINV
ncbi:MAG: PqqD family protein [Prevotella sp.]|nr:PqqD family protein [Prevotella sp.]MBR4651415.1 PqqD family protein [Prevotella sp.]